MPKYLISGSIKIDFNVYEIFEASDDGAAAKMFADKLHDRLGDFDYDIIDEELSADKIKDSINSTKEI